MKVQVQVIETSYGWAEIEVDETQQGWEEKIDDLAYEAWSYGMVHFNDSDFDVISWEEA